MASAATSSLVCLGIALVGLLTATPAHATFPGKNGKIVFNGSGIETIEPDGSGRASLVAGFDPAWSSDGARLAYVGGFPQQISTVDADGGNAIAITSSSGPVGRSHPSWSPDGTKIVFHTGQCFSVFCVADLYTVDSDGSGQTLLKATQPAHRADPAWSPAGDRIAFVDNGSVCDPNSWVPVCNAQIYTIKPDGSGAPAVSYSTADDIQPSWSPDGGKVAFASTRDEPDQAGCYHPCTEIYTINADGTGLSRLTSRAGLDAWPAWSPDGRKIAFVSNRDHPGTAPCGFDCNYEIYTMNADGTEQTRLTNSTLQERTPDWQALPNQRPDCGAVLPTPSGLWPPNHRFRTVALDGATDPDGDAITLTIDGVAQDERVGRRPDAHAGEAANEVELRAQRRPRGDGRVYRIAFTASDGSDECSGVATVEVRRHKKQPAVDSALPSYDSFGA